MLFKAIKEVNNDLHDLEFPLRFSEDVQDSEKYEIFMAKKKSGEPRDMPGKLSLLLIWQRLRKELHG